jgi:hypothetical protein
VVSSGVGRRAVCVGWTGTGDVPASGTSNAVSFTVTTNSTLSWLWRTEYLLSVGAVGAGSVLVNSGWYADGAAGMLTATPSSGNRFVQWVGDVPVGCTTNNPLTVTMDQARSLTAVFAVENGSPAAGLLLYYSFDANDGSVVQDQSGNSNTGMASSGAVWTNAGIVGGAFAFPGAADYVNAGNRVNLASRDFTWCHWVKRSRHSIATDFYEAGLYTGPMTNDPTGWHHWVCTYVAATRERRIYCDGVLLTNDVAGAHYQGSGNLLLGKSWNLNNNFDGLLDEVRVYDRALSPDEVRALHEPPSERRVLVVTGVPDAYGASIPYNYGTNHVATGTVVTATALTPAALGVGTQAVCTGWTGTGDVPRNGVGASVTFTVTGNSTLSWQWQRQFALVASAEPGGTVGSNGSWCEAGQTVQVTATPLAGYAFAGWTGDVPSGHAADNPLTLTMDQARGVRAVFAAALYAIAGRINSAFGKDSDFYIGAYDSATLTNCVARTRATTAGPYQINGLPGRRDYWVAAFRDANTNSFWDDEEAWGVYRYNPLLSLTANATGVNVNLHPLAPPRNLRAAGGAGCIGLRWDANTEAGVVGYHVYRSDQVSGPFVLLTDRVIVRTTYNDTTVDRSSPYFYRVAALLAPDPSDVAFLVEGRPSNVAQGQSDCVTLQLEDCGAPAGGTVRLRVSAPYANGITTKALQLRLLYDRTLLAPVNQVHPSQTCVQRSALTMSMYFADNSAVATGLLSIIAVDAEGTTIKGDGTLFDVVFSVLDGADLGQRATNSWAAAYLFDDALNPLAVDCSDVGVFTVTASPTLGDLNEDGAATIDDVLQAMQLAVGKATATSWQLMVGDLNGNGRIDHGDVHLLQRLVVGLPVNPSTSGAPQYTAGSTAEPPLLAVDRGTTSSGRVLQLAGETTTGYTLSLGTIQTLAGDVVVVPVVLDNASGVAAVSLQVNYDPQVATLLNVTNGTLTTGFGLEWSATNGAVKVLLSSPNALTEGAGVVAQLTFLVAGDAQPGAFSVLTPARAELSGAYSADLQWSHTVAANSGTLWVVPESSVLVIIGLSVSGEQEPTTVLWSSVPGSRYVVECSTNLLTGFEPVVGDIIAVATNTTVRVDVPDQTPRFYRIREE